MNSDKINIAKSLADLLEEEVVATVKEQLQGGDDPILILDQCQEGILEVGRRYESCEYYISGLIMAGEIMRQVSELLQPALKEQIRSNGKGRILLATVQKDIHYIGKNLFKTFLQCSGYDVLDIGEDVAPNEILQQALEYSPDIIGLSCLLSSCYESMREAIEIYKNGTRHIDSLPYVIIGGNVNEKVCQFVGADGWADDAMIGLRLCQRLLRS